MRVLIRGTVLMTALSLVSCAALLAQSSSGGFVMRSGRDTIAVERFVRDGRSLKGDMVFRPAQARIAFEMTLSDQGTVLSLTNRYWTTADSATAAPRQEAKITFTADSAIAELTAPGRPPVTQRLGSKPGALPYINPSTAILELLAGRLRGVALPTTVPMFAVAGGQPFDAAVASGGGDTLSIKFATGEMRLVVDPEGRIMSGRIPAQGITVERVLALGGSAFAAAKVDYSAPADAPYQAIEVTVPTPMGHRLAGTLTLPKTASATNPVPAIVTITGSGPEDRDEHISIVKDYRPFRTIADSLGRRGIAVLRMDDRGVGGSGGDHDSATSADFADDIRAGLAYLRTRPDIAGNRLGLLGHSEGGLIGPMVAATDAKLAALVLLAGPGKPGRPILEFQLRNNFSHDSSRTATGRDSMVARVPAMVDSMGRSNRWLGFFLDYDPLVTARKVRTPVLILQGGTDQQVTPDQAAPLARAFKQSGNRDVTLRIIPNQNHLFIHDPVGFPGGYGSLPNAVLDRGTVGIVVDWAVKRLGPKRPKR